MDSVVLAIRRYRGLIQGPRRRRIDPDRCPDPSPL